MGALHVLGCSVGILAAICGIVLLCMFLFSSSDCDWHYGSPRHR